MSEERTIDAGPRRLERLRERHGAPVRAAPCAIGAIAGGLVAAWAFGVPGRLLGEVSEGLRTAGHADFAVGGVDGASEVRSVVGAVAAACWPVPVAALAGAWLGAAVQGAGRWSFVRGTRRPPMPTAASLGGATVRAAWGLAMAGAAAATVWMHWPAIAALPALGLDAGLARAAPVVTDALLAAVGAGIAVAAVDVAAARMRWRTAARMDTAEAREARRLADGHPEVRAQRRAAARRTVARFAQTGKESHGIAA
ncbi:MAG: EscU/YscU/HrcU family type III secretion system export apparatus switch protein [Phycisphaerales bacterium]